MRTLTFLVIFVGVIGPVTANAQAPGTRPGGSGVDFSGIYAPPVFVGTIAVFEPDEYPFRAEAEKVFNAYDPLVDSPNQVDDCTADLMPGILWSNSPMRFVQEGGRIVMRHERGNTTRSIPIDGPPVSPDQPHTELGYSVAQWEGDVLTIETTHMTSDVIRNNRGYPLSPEARVTERYWRETGENDLHTELVVDDPANYTETFTLGRVWVWAPDEQLQTYECVSLGPRDSEPDIDELARMLEEL